MEWIALVLFVSIFVIILKGYPVAFSLGGLSVLFGLFLSIFYPDIFYINDFKLLFSRILGVLNNQILMAVPLFIFMGIMLEKSGLAESLLETMAKLFGKQSGGLAISTIIVGALLAASTGIVGATVVTMGSISVPIMLKRGYSPRLATAVVAAAGTLGVIIPPSILLVLLADTISSSNISNSAVDVGGIFRAALLPGLILVGGYLVYVIILSKIKPELAPPIKETTVQVKDFKFYKELITVFVLPLLLIILVLGAIFIGIASPTEVAGLGALGATILTLVTGKLNVKVIKSVMTKTTDLTSMVFMIMLGATTFALMFRMLEGDDLLIHIIKQSELEGYHFLILVMVIIFIAGFFIDFIEIIFIFIPVVTPIFGSFGMDMMWVGILLALNLQISFLTPPFGFSLFYLKGVVPKTIKTVDIYRGIVPFVIIQVILIIVIALYPDIIYSF